VQRESRIISAGKASARSRRGKTSNSLAEERRGDILKRENVVVYRDRERKKETRGPMRGGPLWPPRESGKAHTLQHVVGGKKKERKSAFYPRKERKREIKAYELVPLPKKKRKKKLCSVPVPGGKGKITERTNRGEECELRGHGRGEGKTGIPGQRGKKGRYDTRKKKFYLRVGRGGEKGMEA